MRELTELEELNLTDAEDWLFSLKQKPVSFEQASENIYILYNVIKKKGARRLNMSNWHCGTAHCLGGWAQVLFDNDYSFLFWRDKPASPLNCALKTIWPLSQSNWRTYFLYCCDRTCFQTIRLITQRQH